MRRRGMSASYRLAVLLVRPVLLLATRRNWRGGQHLPTGVGYIVCSNHLSDTDLFTLAHFLYDHGALPRFLGKEAVFRIPVVPVAQWGPQDVLAPYGRRLRLLSRFAGRDLDKATMLATADAIVDDITSLLKRPRGERALSARWDPRANGQPTTGNYKRRTA